MNTQSQSIRYHTPPSSLELVPSVQQQRYLQSLGPNESLSLRDLTKNLAMLLVLSLANRSSDLVRLSFERKRYTPDGVYISPAGWHYSFCGEVPVI